MSKYAIKVYGGRGEGEYDGAATLAATARKAREEFVPYVPAHVAVHVVRFSKDGERAIVVKRIKEASYGSRTRSTRHADSRPRLTLKHAQELLRPRGVTLVKREGEYRVNLRGAGDDTAYFTDNLRDAVATGIDMIRHSRGYSDRASRAAPTLKLPRGYRLAPSYKTALKSDVFRGTKHVGTVMRGGADHWHWWLRRPARGKQYHPHGEVMSLGQGVRAVIAADKEAP